MLDQHIKQLKSVDHERRREAIRVLAQSGDPRAVEPLKYAARTDPDPHLREMAAIAVRRLQTLVGAAAAVPDSQASEPAAKPATSPVIVPLARPVPAEPPKSVSEPDRKRARACFERAYAHRLKGETRDAIAELADAFHADPGLASEPRAIGLAADLSGEPAERAVEALLAKSKQRGVRRSRALLGRDATTFIVELLVLFVVLTAVIALFNAGLTETIRKMLGSPINPEAVEREFGSVFRDVRPTDFLNALPAALLILGTLLVWDGLIFIVAVKWRGTGTILGTLKWLMAVQIAAYVAAVLLQPVILVPVLAAASPGIPISQTLTTLSAAISIVCLVTALIAESYLTGREHRIGFVRGFITVVIASLICFGFWAILSVFTFGRSS